MANPQNLKPFKKGNQASKGHGRPPSLKSLFRKKLDEFREVKNKKTGKIEKRLTDDLFAEVGVSKALSGDFRFWKEIKDTVDGKPLQTIESQERIEVDFSTLTDEQLDRIIEKGNLE